MKISARNQLKGTVTSVQEGAVSAVVTVKVGNEDIKANITMEAVKDLGLAQGSEVVAIIKASNVMFAAGENRIENLSARNQLPGTVSTIRKGAVNAHLGIELANGYIVTGSVTNEAIDSLGLQVGAAAVAIIKSTDVLLGIE